ncbi:hypothetical protein J6590_086800 [Homalodisca vitripennis]|nr:hypothetical protein J6590_086800 [Homalodisca vitripennis]
MDDNRVIKVLHEFGVDKISKDDYKIYEDFFCRCDLPSNDEPSEEQSVAEDSISVSDADVSLLLVIPMLDEYRNNVHNININDVILEIEGNVTEVVEEMMQGTL